MVPGWDGGERRKNGQMDHDLLIKINANLENFLTTFQKHVKDDEDGFIKHDNRIKNLERVYWIGVGVIIVVELGIKLLK